MSITFVNHSRKKKLEALLQDDYVMVHLSTQDAALVIPDHLKQDSSVTLKLSFWFKGRLELKEDFIESELSFSGTSFLCIIPYACIWAVTSFGNDFELWDMEMKERLTNVVMPNRTKHEVALKSEEIAAEEAPVKPGLSLAAETSEKKPRKKSAKRPRPLLRRIK